MLCELRDRVLDIKIDPVTQGFEPHAYDLAITANALHATRHLDEALDHCRALLAPSGVPGVMRECTTASGSRPLPVLPAVSESSLRGCP